MLAYMGMFLFLVYIQLLASANYNTFRKQLGSKGELGTLQPKKDWKILVATGILREVLHLNG